MDGDLIKDRDFITAVLQACGALVVVFDPQGRIVLCNRAFEQVTGYSSAELKGKVFFEVLVRPEGREQSRKRLEYGISARAASAFENEWITKSGEPRRIAFSNAPMMNQDGEVEYYITTGIDIADRHRAEQELLKSENQFRSLWEASSEPMFLTDPSGTIVKVNASFSRMLDTQPDALEGMNVTGLFHPEEQEAVREYHRACYASEAKEHVFGTRAAFRAGAVRHLRNFGHARGDSWPAAPDARHSAGRYGA